MTRDTDGFIQSIFSVQLGPQGDFSSWRDILLYNTMNDGPTGNPDGGTAAFGSPVSSEAMQQILADIGDLWNGIPSYFSRGKARDSSLGGNDAINCYPQFNETDDVAEHPFLSTNPKDTSGLSGMGRVYSETYDDQQQVMYMTFGVPQFNNLASFYSNAILGDLARLMNNGVNNTAGNLTYLVGEAIGTFVTLPVLPLIFINNILNNIGSTPITKYYDFQSAMPLYYRAVNSMMIHLTVNMGLSYDTVLAPTGSSQAVTGNTGQNLSADEQAAASLATNNGASTVGLPEMFQDYGFDIYRIMLKKYKYMSADFNPTSVPNSDTVLLATSTDTSPIVDVSTLAGNFLSTTISQFKATFYDASLYVGFRIEKGVDTSESFTNETGESSIAQQINAKAQSARDMNFNLAQGNTGIAGLDAVIKGVGGILSGAADTMGLAATFENILAGNGLIDFPDVWKSSSTSKNYTFNVSLRSPYGDPYSILQNLYIPLALLLAGGLPRAIGQSAYTAPFVCRAYCRGMFAVPLGMISHITIKRGADQFGWSTTRLPTCLDISFEIKDLSPAMYVAIGSGSTWEALMQVFTANSTFQEYLMTLSGMGLADRIGWLRNLRRKATYLLGQVASTKMSPFYWGATLGNTIPARMISQFIPVTRVVPNN